MWDSMTENPMVLDYQRRPRYRKIYDEDYDEHYIVDEHGREIDPALLREDEEEVEKESERPFKRERSIDNPNIDIYEEQQIERFNRKSLIEIGGNK